MAAIELHEDGHGNVYCPRRGNIDVQWCLGCARRTKVEFWSDRAVIVCEPGVDTCPTEADALHVPEQFKLY